MLTRIQPDEHGPMGAGMAEAVRSCVHCGFCLTACPTYREFGQEMDSPRGRILLMKQVLEGELDPAEAEPHIDRCLGCLACETACPSGVEYRNLISPFRALMEPRRERSAAEKLRRWMVSSTLPYPARFRIAATTAGMVKALAPVMPGFLRPMLDLLPRSLPPRQSWPELNPAIGKRRARVALLTGCAQQVLDPDINTATLDILTRNGVEVVVPRGQGCCGALSWHVGDHPAARRFALRNLDAFPRDIDAVVTNAAGCGSGIREYPVLLKGDPREADAGDFARRVCDVSVFLHRLGDLAEIPDPGKVLRIAYHDACHLAHAQGVRFEPRELLRRIPGAEVLAIPDGDLCCGSAGTYNLDQPATAASLGRQKAEAVARTGADLVASGNIGCLNQLRAHLGKLGIEMPVRHTVQVLRDAWDGKC